MTKISKHPYYDDPTAFSKRFPRIEHSQAPTGIRTLNLQDENYKMGPIHAAVVAPSAERAGGYFMSVHGRDRYPTWDEIVWLRYHLIPDAAIMSLLLPNLNNYINEDNTHHKFVFTLEQKGWALDPTPTCSHCGNRLAMIPTSIAGTQAAFECPEHGWQMAIDMATWNEEHGNGFHAS